MNYLSKMGGTQIDPEHRKYSEQIVAGAGMCDDPSFDFCSFPFICKCHCFLHQKKHLGKLTCIYLLTGMIS